jgi:hypothetical protein
MITIVLVPELSKSAPALSVDPVGLWLASKHLKNTTCAGPAVATTVPVLQLMKFESVTSTKTMHGPAQSDSIVD